MADDIVTRLRDNCACGVSDEFGIVCASCTAADEIERLRVNQDMWKRTCAKLVGMMLPYSLLMTESEREELKIILSEASNG
jgi:hypothetical protein